tara:strand:+ start:242 stop:604 length:363 start_codon:yes stop_codon:yes gene_type:complete
MATLNGFESFDPMWWRRVLEETEPAQYYSSPRGMAFARRSPSRQRFFGNAYQNIMQDYYGQAGTSMREGREPMSFMEFLDPTQEENRIDPFTARYSRLPQTSRGVTGMAASPRTRYMFNY